MVAQKERASVAVVRGATLKKKRENLPSSPSLCQERRAAAQHRRGGAPISIAEESRAGEGILVSAFGV
uniref:Uncharacterized protein n=1 Tax=Oryza nivara TaxID=4536 RepID=A0A0E0GAE6_ORYNI